MQVNNNASYNQNMTKIARAERLATSFMNTETGQEFNIYTMSYTSDFQNDIKDMTVDEKLLLINNNIQTLTMGYDPVKAMNGRMSQHIFAETTLFDKANNSITFAKGAKFMIDGFELILGDTNFAVKDLKKLALEARGKTQKEVDELKRILERMYVAQDVGTALSDLVRWANGQFDRVTFNGDKSNIENALRALKACGIDTTRDFTINGTTFYVDDNRNIRIRDCQIEAQAAYEMLYGKSLVFSDGQTRNAAEVMSKLFLPNVPDEVMTLWLETITETKINPLKNSADLSLIRQLSIEQDYLTKGDSDLFGDSAESTIAGVKKILERISNPLGVVDKNQYAQEAVFYQSFLRKLQSL